MKKAPYIVFLVLFCFSLPSLANDVIRYSPETQADNSFRTLKQPINLKQIQKLQKNQQITIESIANFYANLVVDSGRYNPFRTKKELADVIRLDMLEKFDENFINEMLFDFYNEERRNIHTNAFLERYDQIYSIPENYEKTEKIKDNYTEKVKKPANKNITVESIASLYANIIVSSGRYNPLKTENELAEAIKTEMYALNSKDSLNRLIKDFSDPKKKNAYIKQYINGYDKMFTYYGGMESECLNCY